jgi:toxin-antitoxin system PIN domain toxin
MIGVDSNLLVYAHRRDAPWHADAKRCLTQLAEGPASWAIPWACIHEFIAIVTHPKIYHPPSTIAQAVEQVECWRGSPSLVLIGEGDAYWERLRRLLIGGKIAGSKVHDARVAAVCLMHGVRELWTVDRDFSRFGDLRVRNPLVG